VTHATPREPTWRFVVLACLVGSISCESSDRREAVIGRYASTGVPALTLDLRPDGVAVERIDGRELNGRWGLWSTTARGCGVARSRIELTGLVFGSGEPQTNNRVYARLRKRPHRLVIDFENRGSLELPRDGATR